jgi:PhnB protein
MASRLNPYLSFDGNAREAMETYKAIFGGELSINTFGDLGAAPDEASKDKVMHSMLETPAGFTLMGSDTPPGMPYQPGNTIAVSISGDDEDALRGYWEALSGGGQVTLPFEEQMWGDIFGMCTDRFGVSWMVDVVRQQQTA